VTNKILAIAGVIAVVLSGVVVRSCDSKNLVDARQQVELAQDSLHAVQIEVRKTNAHAESLKVQGVKLREESDSALRVAKKAKLDASRLADKFKHDSSVSSADSALESTEIVIASLELALDKQKQRADSMKLGWDEALTSLARLSAAAGHLDTASHALVKASHPSFWARITPAPNVGATAGINTRGQFDVVAGVGLGWRF
jgi:hypothetical protein